LPPWSAGPPSPGAEAKSAQKEKPYSQVMFILSRFFHAVNLFFAKIPHFFAEKSAELLP
jgi:hypothetical protein